MQTSPLSRPAAWLAACALALAGCSSVSVGYDYDPAASFEGLRTFSWREFEGSAVGNRVVSPLVEKAIRDATSEELRLRGYQDVKDGGDFTISGFAVVNQRVDISYVDDMYGYHRRNWYVPGHTQTWVTTYDEGTLVLDIARGGTGAPLWRGTATAIVDETQTPEERHVRIRDAIRQVLANFPPPPPAK